MMTRQEHEAYMEWMREEATKEQAAVEKNNKKQSRKAALRLRYRATYRSTETV
jgi:hypothetical protein